MVGVRKRGEQIRQFILDNVEEHPTDVVNLTCQAFDISRQAVNKHVHRLVEQESVGVEGSTRSRHYYLRPLVEWEKIFPLDQTISEDLVWRDHVAPQLGDLPDNVMNIWQYGITEIFNNVIDHSSGELASVNLKRTATTSEVHIYDDGVGIFKKIQLELGLHDERHSVLELAKGKFTTDPDHHSGEGIFFSSRVFDDFAIMSGTVFFSHEHARVEDWVSEVRDPRFGTFVRMKLENDSSRTLKQVFDRFTSDEDYGFTKTIVPVHLTQYGDDNLVSRSQAKRLLARIDKFGTVVLDFEGVDSIGQAFADEIFRVFANRHPDVKLHRLNANYSVEQMIRRATSRGKA